MKTRIVVLVTVAAIVAAALVAWSVKPPHIAPSKGESATDPVTIPIFLAFHHFIGRWQNLRTRDYKSAGLGMTSLEVVVDPTGRVVSVAPDMSTPVPAPLIAQAVAFARHWRFTPFQQNSRRVYARIRGITLEFVPPDARPNPPVPFPEIHDWRSLRIKLARSACYGTCPIYTLEIAGDGTVNYHGEGFVAIQGDHSARIPQRDVKDLFERFRRAEFFDLFGAYRASITDNPTYTVSIAFDDVAKQIFDYVGERAGMPSVVTELETAIDRAAGIGRWTLGTRDTVPSLVAEHWDFKSVAYDNQAMLAGVAHYGDAATLKALLAQGSPVTYARRADAVYGVEHLSALENAAARGETEMVEALLAAGAGADRAALADALVAAAAHGDERLMRALFRYGEAGDHHDDDGNTVLMNAARSGIPAVVTEVLAHHPDIEARNIEGQTALMLVSDPPYREDETDLPGTDRPRVIALLLKSGAEVDARDQLGNTALIANGIYPDVAVALLAAGAAVNARNNEGETALMRSLDPALTRVLLEGGADPWLRDKQGRTALDVLLAERYDTAKDIVKVLKDWIKHRPAVH